MPITYICVATADGTITNAPGTWAAGDHLWRIRHEGLEIEGPDAEPVDFSTSHGLSGSLSDGEVAFQAGPAQNGVKVFTGGSENRYRGTASVSGAECGIPLPDDTTDQPDDTTAVEGIVVNADEDAEEGETEGDPSEQVEQARAELETEVAGLTIQRVSATELAHTGVPTTLLLLLAALSLLGGGVLLRRRESDQITC